MQRALLQQRAVLRAPAARRAFFGGIYDSIASSYKASVAESLNKYGLKYDDVLNEALPSVQEAVARLDPEEKIARDRRMKRAIDLSFKKKGMPEGSDGKPFENYLYDHQQKVQEEQDEREILNRY
eukprot:CAMPEP_0118869912 /NCGR_PEP_ID=MMETSP1163-20130328/13058_1 /TAXON_ID=124430 /ORGANISM="Phaeomonas parva, Strain CCMP2877" /LENGTH=124 /DNA_ID=CAMNT_0006804851 /DNA_START=97 /DNA_END=471 /DNA_ORIENTATION=+